MWIAIDEVTALGVTRRWVEKKIASGGWQSRDSGRVGRNGKPIREVKLESLPEEMQAAWARRNMTAESIGQEVEIAESPATATTLADALSRLDADTREAMMAEINRLNSLIDRFDVVIPRSTVVDGVRVWVKEIEALCDEAVCTNELVLAREPGRAKRPSPYTLENWSRERKEKGLLVFLRAAPTQRKQSDKRVAKFTPAARQWLNENWRNYPTTSHCIDKLNEKAKEKGWKIPSNTTLRRILRVPPVVRAIVFGNDKEYTSKWKPYVPRTIEDLAALQIVCGDHHILDVIAWSDVQKALVRLWFTAWQDIRTGLIWGWHIDYVPSSHTIGSAYANGIRTYGAQPFSRDGYKSLAYTDNGKDYKGRNVKGEIVVHKRAAQIDGGLQLILTTQGVGLLNEVDVEQFLARFYNGREKPIERTFNDLATYIQNEFFRWGWTGRNTKDRPDEYRELYTRHNKAMKRGQHSPFPTEQDVRATVTDWVSSYNTKGHIRSTLEGRTVVPLTELNQLYTTKYEISNEALALMLLKPTRGTLDGKNGLKILGGTYTHAALSEYKGVKGADGKPLQIEARYSDDSYLTAWIVLPDGRVVEGTRLERSSITNPNKETHKQVAMLARSELKMAKDFSLLQQSRLRGETVEDRVQAQIEAAYGEQVELPIAVNEDAQARVQKLTRLDKRLHVVPQPRVTPEAVSQVEADDSIFETPSVARISEFDFEE